MRPGFVIALSMASALWGVAKSRSLLRITSVPPSTSLIGEYWTIESTLIRLIVPVWSMSFRKSAMRPLCIASTDIYGTKRGREAPR
jgi:hypothetical protein